MAGAERLGVYPDADVLERLGAYRDLLLRWNRSVNLIARTDVGAVEFRHLLDALTVLPPLRAFEGSALSPVIDLGSGGGLPGLVLACVDPDRAIALVEPVSRKAAFLRAAIRTLGLDRVTVHGGRAEDVAREVHERLAPMFRDGGRSPQPPVVVARAVAPLDRLCGLARPLGVPGGRFLFPKGRGYAAELAGLPADVRRVGVHEFRLPPDERPTFVVELAPGAAGS